MSYRKVKKGNAPRSASASGHRTAPSAKSSSAKSGGGAGKKVLAVIAAVLIIGIVGSGIAGIIFSPSRGDCKEIISEFQTSCNELDVNGIVGTLKPSIANTLKITLGITSMVTSTPTDEMLENVLNSIGSFGGLSETTGLSVSDLFQMIEIKPLRYGFPGRTRKVKCKAYFGTLEQNIYISVTKRDGDVYISDVSLKK